MKKQTFNMVVCSMLGAGLFLPLLGWTHGAVDIPISRQVKCKIVGGMHWPTDGSGISDVGCRDAFQSAQSTNQGIWATQQWHEFARNVADYNNDNTVRAAIPDGLLCSAGDPRKSSMDHPSANWYKTVVKTGQNFTVRIAGTAPHVPSFAKVYITKPGFNSATQKLRWDDLTLLKQERFTTAKTNWGANPPAVSGSGFFTIDVPIPAGRTGTAVLYTRWQREDPVGEGFYNCSDIRFEGNGGGEEPGIDNGGGGSGQITWHDKGEFVPRASEMPDIGDIVSLRVFSAKKNADEVVNESVTITANNQKGRKWLPELVAKIDRHSEIIKIGKMDERGEVVYQQKIHDNLIYLANANDSAALSINRSETAINPGKPEASISGNFTVKPGEKTTLTSTSVVHNANAAQFTWSKLGNNNGLIFETNTNKNTMEITAPQVKKERQFKVRLTVQDTKNGKQGSVTETITVTP